MTRDRAHACELQNAPAAMLGTSSVICNACFGSCDHRFFSPIASTYSICRRSSCALIVSGHGHVDLARRDATIALLCGPPDRRVSLGFSVGTVRTFSVLSIIMLDYSLPAARRLGNAPGVTSWDWM